MTELEIEAIKAMPDSLSTSGHYITTLNGVVCCISKSGHQMK